MHRPSGTGPADARRPLNIVVSDIAPSMILCVLSGEIDLATAVPLREKLTEAIRLAPSHLLIDVSEVRFPGSAGLGVLLEIAVAQQKAGHHLAVVVGGNLPVARSLRAAGRRTLDLHTELATAVQACRAHTSTGSDEVPQP